MIRNFGSVALFCAGIILLSQVHCTTTVTGGSSGTEVSAVIGTALSVDGSPVSNAKVRLRPKAFLADSGKSSSYCATHSILDTITDNDGAFGFTNLLPDSYTIEIVLNDTLGSELSCIIDTPFEKELLQPVYMAPMAELTGTAQIYYGNPANIFIQPFGLDRTTKIDETGYFSLKIPQGSHTFHISAFLPNDSAHAQPFDQMDISLYMFPGEERDAGMLQLRPPPPAPCEDGTCDSMVVQMILNVSGNGKTPLSDVIETDENGRIVAFKAHDLAFNMGVPYDIVRLTALKVLDLSHTHLQVMFPGITYLTNLEVARFEDNHLPMFSTFVGSLQHLRELNLDNNELMQLPESIVNCGQLESLSVKGNRLCYLDEATAIWLTQFDSTWQTTQRCP